MIIIVLQSIVCFVMNIHIFGDSHAKFNFTNIKYTNVFNHYVFSITMHRVGRDSTALINFSSHFVNNNDIIVYQFGEVDCRCHIGKQLLLGRGLNDIIDELVGKYIESINKNKRAYTHLKIIVCCVPPTMCQEFFESIHGPITHEFPFVGTDYDRSNFTMRVNQALKQKCLENNFIFFDYYDLYKNNMGTLNVDLSDTICHIAKNELLLNEFYKVVDAALTTTA